MERKKEKSRSWAWVLPIITFFGGVLVAPFFQNLAGMLSKDIYDRYFGRLQDLKATVMGFYPQSPGEDWNPLTGFWSQIVFSNQGTQDVIVRDVYIGFPFSKPGHWTQARTTWIGDEEGKKPRPFVIKADDMITKTFRWYFTTEFLKRTFPDFGTRTRYEGNLIFCLIDATGKQHQVFYEYCTLIYEGERFSHPQFKFLNGIKLLPVPTGKAFDPSNPAISNQLTGNRPNPSPPSRGERGFISWSARGDNPRALFTSSGNESYPRPS